MRWILPVPPLLVAGVVTLLPPAPGVRRLTSYPQPVTPGVAAHTPAVSPAPILASPQPYARVITPGVSRRKQRKRRDAAMETTRFDQITSTLGETSTRRGALRALAAAAFGLGSVAVLGSQESAAKRRKKGKKKRPTCQGQPDDTPCNGDGRCLNGVCQARPTCATSPTSCANATMTPVVDRACCSSTCGAPFAGQTWCTKSATGQPCYETNDCSLIADTCRGYVCTAT
jgi:hypothetical protein